MLQLRLTDQDYLQVLILVSVYVGTHPDFFDDFNLKFVLHRQSGRSGILEYLSCNKCWNCLNSIGQEFFKWRSNNTTTHCSLQTRDGTRCAIH